MNINLATKLEEWQSIRQLTIDLLCAIPENDLNFSVGKNMGSLGKQFRHIGDVQLCYSDAIKTGEISFDNYKKDYSIENSILKLKTYLLDTDKEMLCLIDKNQLKTIDWFGDCLPLEEHINSLIQHEILHQGELIVYIRALGINFPKSWELWGL